MTDTTQEELPKCELCGEPMPPGETMFKYHGYSGPCPKPPLPQKPVAFIGHVSLVQDCGRAAQTLGKLEKASRNTVEKMVLVDAMRQLVRAGELIQSFYAAPQAQAPSSDDVREIVREEIARSETERGDRIFPGVHK
jgi:hypothetical protein